MTRTVDCENIGPIKTPHNFVNFNYTLYSWKLKWMRFGFLTISTPDGKRSPPESFAFVVFFSLYRGSFKYGSPVEFIKSNWRTINLLILFPLSRQTRTPRWPQVRPLPFPGPPHSSQHRQKTWWKVPVCQFIQPQQVCYFQWPQSIRFLLLLFDPCHHSGSSRGCVSTDQSSPLRRLHCSSLVWSVRTGLSVPPVSVCMDCHNSNCPVSR